MDDDAAMSSTAGPLDPNAIRHGLVRIGEVAIAKRDDAALDRVCGLVCAAIRTQVAGDATDLAGRGAHSRSMHPKIRYCSRAAAARPTLT